MLKVLPSLLVTLFIGLKLTGHIAWPWLWVLSPIWIPLVAALAVMAVLALGIRFCAMIAVLLEKKQARVRTRSSKPLFPN